MLQESIHWWREKKKSVRLNLRQPFFTLVYSTHPLGQTPKRKGLQIAVQHTLVGNLEVLVEPKSGLLRGAASNTNLSSSRVQPERLPFVWACKHLDLTEGEAQQVVSIMTRRVFIPNDRYYRMKKVNALFFKASR